MKTYEELARAFVKSYRGRLLFVAGQWMEAIDYCWWPRTNRYMNRLIRNAGWHAVNAASVRRCMEEELLWGFQHSGPLPSLAPTLSVEMMPFITEFLEINSGSLVYDYRSKHWMSLGPGQERWTFRYDHEVNRMIRAIPGHGGVNNARRALEQHIAFATPGVS